MNDTLNTLVLILLPIIGAGMGYLIKQNIEKRKELLNEVTKERRVLYQQYVDLVVDILKKSKSNKEMSDTEMTTKLYDFYKKYILYASPGVINSFSDYFQYLYKFNNNVENMDSKTHFRKLSAIMREMRKDIGLSNKKLGKDGVKIFRALLTDFDNLMG